MDVALLLTIWPYCVGGIAHADCIIRVRPLHLCVEIRLQVRRAIVALEIAF